MPASPIRLRTLALCAAAASLQACTSSTRPDTDLAHPVFFTLHNPEDAPLLIDDCNTYLRDIPGITAYLVGTPLDIGRPAFDGRRGVDGSYHVGLLVTFESIDAYRAYLDHPDHVRLVQTWGPRCETIRVYDIIAHEPD